MAGLNIGSSLGPPCLIEWTRSFYWINEDRGLKAYARGCRYPNNSGGRSINEARACF